MKQASKWNLSNTDAFQNRLFLYVLKIASPSANVRNIRGNRGTDCNSYNCNIWDFIPLSSDPNEILHKKLLLKYSSCNAINNNAWLLLLYITICKKNSWFILCCTSEGHKGRKINVKFVPRKHKLWLVMFMLLSYNFLLFS